MRNVSQLLLLALLALAVLSNAHSVRADDAALETRLAGLRPNVAALPDAAPDQALKKATLQWALDEAQFDIKTGRSDDAQALAEDVAQSLTARMGERLAAPPNLLPPIPHFAQNPVAQGAMATLDKTLAAGVSANPNAMMNNPQGVGDFNNHLAPQALLMAEALCHPQSPRVGDPKIVPVMFHYFETMYRTHLPGSNLLGNFGHSAGMAEMYLIVQTVYPSLILPSRKREWETSIRANADAIMAAKAAVFRAGKPGTAYPNDDIKVLNALVYTDMALHHPEYREVADAGERLMSTAIFPDGGWTYIGDQNENYTYHTIDISETCRLWQLTGSLVARANIETARWYIPLSIEPPGVAEYSTSPDWKHYWNQIKGGEAALMVADVLNDPQNLRVARMQPLNGDLILASFYRDDFAPAPTPDDYFVYDRNILGPRGRFGPFSFSGTSRATPIDNRGKSTYAGCMLLYPANALPKGVSPTYPLDSALDVATVEVEDRAPAARGAGFHNAPDALAREETDGACVGRNVAAVTATYRLGPYHGAAIDWTGQQAWLYTAQRLVGLVTVTSRKDQDVYGVNGSLSFLWDQPKNATARKFQSLPDGSLQYGGLVTTIHEQDYGRVVTDYSNERNAVGEIRLLDPKATDESEAAPIHYAQGETHYYLAEIRPASSPPADAVSRIHTDGGLIGIDLKEGTAHYRLIFNPTTAPLTYQATLGWNAPQVMLHTAGEQYRPAWIGSNHQEEDINGPKPVATVNDAVTVPVPAGAHVLLTTETR